MDSYHKKNRMRLLGMIEQISEERNPKGWQHITSIAVGGLLSVGFSQDGPYLLVVSTAGRSVINCDNGEKIARDYEEYAGLDKYGLHCQGIGVLENELIFLCGIDGGGLPTSNEGGESLELVSPNWPLNSLILSESFKHPFSQGDQEYCKIIYTDYVRAYGFSWCGNYIVAASSSDLNIWKRESKLS